MRTSSRSARLGTARPFVFAVLGILALVGALAAVHYFASPVIAPNVVGDSLEDAATKLAEAGIDVDIADAHGTVTSQHPIGGEQWFRYQAFTLTYTDETGSHTIG